VTYGGPAVPDWLDTVLRDMVGAAASDRIDEMEAP
jgi:hypothetical protein